MNFRTTGWLLLLVCLVALVIWVLDSRLDATAERQAHQVELFSADLGKASMLELSTEMFRAVCARREDGWRLVHPIEGRVDTSRIERILALEAMRSIETITADQRRSRSLSLEDYGLAKPAATLIVRDGIRRQELWVGQRSPLGSVLYVKFADSDDVLATQTNLLDELPARLEDLRDRLLFSGDALRAVRLEIKRPQGSFIQLARLDGTWMIQQPFQANADGAKIEAMLTALQGARIRTFVWDRPADPAGENAAAAAVDGGIVSRAEAYGLLPDEAAAQVAVWMTGRGAGQELLFGKAAVEPTPPERQETYAKFGNGESIFTVDRDLVDMLAVVPLALRDRSLFTIQAEDVHFLSVRKGTEEVVLHRPDESGWMLMQPLQWKADEEIVEEFLRGVTRLRAEAFLEGPATNLSAVGLQPPKLVLKIGLAAAGPSAQAPAAEPAVAGTGTGEAAGKSVYSLCIGNPAGDAKTLFARFEEEETVFLILAESIEALGNRPADPLAYRDRTMLSIVPENIRRITLAGDGREQTVARTAEGGWAPENTGTNRMAVADLTRLLAHVSNLRAARIDCRTPRNLSAYGLDPARLALTLGLSGEEGIQKKILMGFRTGTDEVYAMVQGQDVVFALPERVCMELAQDLVQEMPAAAVVPERPAAAAAEEL